MNQSELVSNLIKPLAEIDIEAVSPKEVFLVALRWPTDGWASEALDWLEQGVEIDSEVAAELESFASNKQNSQSTRHQAFTLAKRWQRIHESRPFV